MNRTLSTFWGIIALLVAIVINTEMHAAFVPAFISAGFFGTALLVYRQTRS